MSRTNFRRRSSAGQAHFLRDAGRRRRQSRTFCENPAGFRIAVKIIENNRNAVRRFPEMLPNATIIYGDGTDRDLLDEEVWQPASVCRRSPAWTRRTFCSRRTAGRHSRAAVYQGQPWGTLKKSSPHADRQGDLPPGRPTAELIRGQRCTRAPCRTQWLQRGDPCTLGGAEALGSCRGAPISPARSPAGYAADSSG